MVFYLVVSIIEVCVWRLDLLNALLANRPNFIIFCICYYVYYLEKVQLHVAYEDYINYVQIKKF